MKVSCQSCSAKYTIADEKVSGRIVKIRCKKCGATIVVNGNDMSADAADAAAETEVWTLSVDDTDQRTMTAAEVATAYKSGVINDETFCWKEGMDDWLPLREIDALAGALGKNVSVMPASMEDQNAAGGGDLFGGFGGSSGGSDLGLGGGGGSLFGDAPLAAAAPAAARRSGGRAPAGDLFGGAATAGGEEEILTSAPGLSAPPSGDTKLTGQRNENSVLFSLNALTSSDTSSSGRGATTAEGDGSGLIDIRALSSSMNTSDNSSSKVDDIMNLSGGGAFNAALTAPILAPPVMVGGGMGSPTPSYAPEQQQTSSGKGLMIGLMGLGAFILIAALVVVFAFKDDGKDEVAKNDPPKTAEPEKTVAADPNSGAAAANTGAGAVAAPTSSTNAVAPNVGGAAATAGTPGKSSGKSGGTVADTKPAEPAAPTKPAEPSKPKSLAESMKEAAGNTGGGGGSAPTAQGGSAPFDKGAALAALGGVNVASCKKDSGGSGHVKIIFAPSGSVSSATVDDGPFVGTPVGGCVAGKYRGARVPPFAGSPVTVGKSFSIN